MPSTRMHQVHTVEMPWLSRKSEQHASKWICEAICRQLFVKREKRFKWFEWQTRLSECKVMKSAVAQ